MFRAGKRKVALLYPVSATGLPATKARGWSFCDLRAYVRRAIFGARAGFWVLP